MAKAKDWKRVIQSIVREWRGAAARNRASDSRAARCRKTDETRLGEGRLREGRKSDLAKLAIPARSRQETALTLEVIALRLNLRSPQSANARPGQWRGTHRAAEESRRSRHGAEREPVSAMLMDEPLTRNQREHKCAIPR